MSLQTIDFDRIHLKEQERILDLGCGEGRHAISAYMVQNLDAVGVDLSLNDLKTTRERFGEFIEADNALKSLVISVANGQDLPFATESFDKVICSEVLEHIHEYKAVIAEINRVLKTGGIAAISVPRYYFFPATLGYTCMGPVRWFIFGLLDRLPDRDPLLEEPDDEEETRAIDYRNLETRPVADANDRDHTSEGSL